MWPENLEILQKEGGGLPIMWQKSWLTRFLVLPFFAVHVVAIAKVARDCDLIHANWTLSGAAALAGQTLHQRPVILTVQGSDIVRAARLPVIDKLTRVVLGRCKSILALSSALAQATVALGIPQGRVRVIPNGVDVDHFVPPAAENWREPIILFVGALSEIKGCAYLIAAMPHVLEAEPKASLIVIGVGPQQLELQVLASRIGVESKVQFLGSQSPTQVRDWMRLARVFVLPSVEEGLGVVLLEALACGTPCIGSRVGGIPDVITPDVGLLTPVGDPAALASAIKSALTLSRDAWQGLSRAARERAEREYDWRLIASQLISVYHNALRR
jgi:glycosyltransferase involved in cell wall biosynthesis